MQPADSALAPRPGLRAAPAPPTHPCLRCGMPVALDRALCERCNPLALPQPAASQAHGTILLAVVLSVAVLAVLGRMAVGGVGPFSGTISATSPEPAGLEVTITVHNDGTGAGSSTCRVYAAGDTGIGPDSAYLLSPSVAAGTTVTFSGLVTTLGTQVRPLAVDCR